MPRAITSKPRTGFSLHVVALGLAAAATVLVTSITLVRGAGSDGRSADSLAEGNESDASGEQQARSAAIVLLHRLGVGPAELAAAGVQISSAQSLLEEAEATDVSSLVAADQSLFEARQAAAAARKKLVNGTAPIEEIDGLRALVDAEHSAAAAQSAIIDSLFESVTADLPTSQLSALTTIRANARAWPGIDRAHLAAERNESDFVALRDALDAERIATADGRPVPPAASAILAVVRGEPQIATARDAAEQNGAALADLWREGQAVPPGS